MLVEMDQSSINHQIWTCNMCTVQNEIYHEKCVVCDSWAPVFVPTGIEDNSGSTDFDFALALEFAEQERLASRERTLNSRYKGNVRVSTMPVAWDNDLGSDQDDYEDPYENLSGDPHELRKQILIQHQKDRSEENVTKHDKSVGEQVNSVRLSLMEGKCVQITNPVSDASYNKIKVHFHAASKGPRKARKERTKQLRQGVIHILSQPKSTNTTTVEGEDEDGEDEDDEDDSEDGGEVNNQNSENISPANVSENISKQVLEEKQEQEQESQQKQSQQSQSQQSPARKSPKPKKSPAKIPLMDMTVSELQAASLRPPLEEQMELLRQENTKLNHQIYLLQNFAKAQIKRNEELEKILAETRIQLKNAKEC